MFKQHGVFALACVMCAAFATLLARPAAADTVTALNRALVRHSTVEFCAETEALEPAILSVSWDGEQIENMAALRGTLIDADCAFEALYVHDTDTGRFGLSAYGGTCAPRAYAGTWDSLSETGSGVMAEAGAASAPVTWRACGAPPAMATDPPEQIIREPAALSNAPARDATVCFADGDDGERANLSLTSGQEWIDGFAVLRGEYNTPRCQADAIYIHETGDPSFNMLTHGGICPERHLFGRWDSPVDGITTVARADGAFEARAWTRVACGDLGETVPVPAGEFPMGCHPDHNGGIYDCVWRHELPLHTVQLDAYQINKNEVTNAAFAAFLNDRRSNDCFGYDCVNLTGARARIALQDGHYVVVPGYAEHPAVQVTWYGANAFCLAGGGRLPTEAEWEMAARGPAAQAYPWGDEHPNCTLANSAFAFDSVCEWDTTPVGNFPAGASPYGALDMAGNVWEWTNDWLSASYYAASPVANPPGPVGGVRKVARGGSYNSAWHLVRTAYREPFSDPAAGYFNVGFRCAAMGQ